MKSTAFFDTLRRELKGLPQSAIDEILADYREYIGDAQAAGRNEEDVIAALGDPVKLARELKAHASYQQWQQRRSFGNLARVVAAIAGLGLLQLLLLGPFLLYLLFLTIGYAVSIALTVAGAGALIALGSHHLFGVPPQFTTVSVGSYSTSSTAVTDANSQNAGHDSGTNMIQAQFDGLKVDHNRFVLRLDKGAQARLITANGPVEVNRDQAGVLAVESPNPAASALVKKDADGTVSIARNLVQMLDFNDTSDGHLNLVHETGVGAAAYTWTITGKDGSKVSFDQDTNGDTHHFRATDSDSSVVFDNHGLTIDDSQDHFHISGLDGKTIQDTVLRYALFALPIGLLGLAFCIWLSWLTVRALVWYTRRQIEAISTRLGHDTSN